MRLVEVKWDDAHMHGPGWDRREDAERFRPARCRSVGYIVRKSRKSVTLAQSAGTRDVANLICIPRAWIRSCRRLVRKGGKS